MRSPSFNICGVSGTNPACNEGGRNITSKECEHSYDHSFGRLDILLKSSFGLESRQVKFLSLWNNYKKLGIITINFIFEKFRVLLIYIFRLIKSTSSMIGNYFATRNLKADDDQNILLHQGIGDLNRDPTVRVHFFS